MLRISYALLRAVRRPAAPRSGAIGLCAGLTLTALWACDLEPPRLEAIDCDPIEDTGCPAKTHCRLVHEGHTLCLPSEAAPTPTGCTVASCAPGQACVEIEGRVACHSVCQLESGDGCAQPEACVFQIGEPARGFGLCAARCTLEASAQCGAHASCAPIAGLSWPICVAAGAAQLDAPCDGAQRCAPGLACLKTDGAPRCHRLCDRQAADETCAQGWCTGQIAHQHELGFCSAAPPSSSR